MVCPATLFGSSNLRGNPQVTELGLQNLRGLRQARDWKAAIEASNKSSELRNGGDSFDWFFLAMANWQLGKKAEARKWYDEAVQWMDKNQPKDEELRRFRSEAEALLGMKKK